MLKTARMKRKMGLGKSKKIVIEQVSVRERLYRLVRQSRAGQSGRL